MRSVTCCVFNLVKAAGGLAALALMLTAPAAAADDSYYKGKTIRIVVGFGVGGGYDAYSRMLAPEFAKKLGATVIVENQPGAGGLSSLNRFSRAPADGLQMTLVNGTSAAISQLIGDKGLRFDLTELKQLGITDYSQWLLLVQPKSPHKTLQDLMNRKEPLQFGASGRLDSLGVGALFACHTIKLNCKVVAGYKGSAQVSLALAQGEMDALYVSHTSAYNYVKAGSAKPIVTWNRERSNLFPDLPTVTEVLKLTDEQLWWLDTRNTIEGLGRMLVAPPSTPKAQVDTLRTAAKAILTDKAFIAAAEKKKRPIKFIEAPKVDQMVRTLLSEITPAQKAQIKTMLLGK